MPELPEVETVRSTLELALRGETLSDVIIHYGKIIREDHETFIRTLKGKRLVSIERKGKYLMFIFETHVLNVHLRMEGKFYLRTDEPLQKHEHVSFIFASGKILRYHDVRKFGTMDLRSIEDYLVKDPILSLGPEPKDASADQVYYLLQKTKVEIKASLLDQSIVSGLGNIYVDETLHLSGIDPRRPSHRISFEETKTLLKSATLVLDKAVRLGGTTIRSYTSSLGVSGRFQNELRVHMQKGKPCPVCGTPIQKIKVKGRGTYVCEQCQH